LGTYDPVIGSGNTKKFKVASGKSVSTGDFVSYMTTVYGTDTAINSTTAIVYPKVTMLSATKALIIYSTTTDYLLYGMVCTISGTTITAGTAVQLSSVEYSGYYMKAVALSETKVFIAFSNSSSFYLYGMVCTISGTSITVNSTKQLSSTLQTANYVDVEVLNSSTVFIYHNLSNKPYGMVCTISGTTITAGTDTAINVFNTSSTRMKVSKLSETSVICVGDGGSLSTPSARAVVCTISGTTITVGTGVNVLYDSCSDHTCSGVIGLSSSKALCIVDDIYGFILSISGTTITVGARVTIASKPYYGMGVTSMSLISNGLVHVTYNYNSSSGAYLYNAIITIHGNGIGCTLTQLSTTQNTGGRAACGSYDGITFIAHSNGSSYAMNGIVANHTIESNGSGIIGVAKAAGSAGATIDIYTV